MSGQNQAVREILVDGARADAALQLVSSGVEELVIDLRAEPATVSLGDRKTPLVVVKKPRIGSSRRAFDVVAAGLGLLLAAPLLVAVASLVKLTSKGPVAYRSERLAYRGGTFDAYKFRSMRPDADERLSDHLASDASLQHEYERSGKLKNDPRVTPVGSFIRKYSIDELPQLLNVLKGEMSLVGPRPKLPEEGPRYGAALDAVLSVRPGLTGLWQVSGRSNLEFEERVFLDVVYVGSQNAAGDLVILGKTASQAWRPDKHGAF